MQMIEQRPQQAKILQAVEVWRGHWNRQAEAHRCHLPHERYERVKDDQCTRTSYAPLAKFVPDSIGFVVLVHVMFSFYVFVC